MALPLDTIRETASRVAASHHLELVDLEFSGGAKFRTLRVFIEKDEPARAALAAQAAEGTLEGLPSGVPGLSSNIPIAHLSGITHEDCENFARDFGTVIDIEDLVPGAEYTLEVSSPGLERRLATARDFTRFTGSLVKLQLFNALTGSSGRHLQGRLTAFDGQTLTLDLAAIKQKGRAKKSAAPLPATLQVPLAGVERANLIAEF